MAFCIYFAKTNVVTALLLVTHLCKIRLLSTSFINKAHRNLLFQRANEYIIYKFLF